MPERLNTLRPISKGSSSFAPMLLLGVPADLRDAVRETQRDLSLAYTPGVAEPCLEIARDPRVYKYTIKGNLVAVVSNGTAVLGLGNIGPSPASR
jgi:hypothetical protein